MKNVIYIYADDLGRGMLSCYGQKIIKTENIDALARRGMKFDHFCGTAFCAPARASLICGIHDGHAGRWTFSDGGLYKKLDTGEITFEELQESLQAPGIERLADGNYLAQVFKKAGYDTAEIGKLEWGFSTTAAEMEVHGWDYHYGYYDHQRCHGYYPPYLWENGKQVMIPGNTDVHCGRSAYSCKQTGESDPNRDMTGRQVYSQDLFDEKILSFLEQHRDRPFFLFHPSQLPHGNVFSEVIHPQVKDRDDLTMLQKEYASMVLRLDETVGKIVKKVEELGLRENTLIIFASDNGHTIEYQNPNHTLDGTAIDNRDHPWRSDFCGDPFDGNDGMAGVKFTNWNGGCVIPFIASCPGIIEEGAVCNTLATNYDTMATMADLLGVEIPATTDGLSYLPLLRQQENPRVHDYVIYCSAQGPAVVTQDGWKLRVFGTMEDWQQTFGSDDVNSDRIVYQLYDLNNDWKEEHECGEGHPELVKKLKKILVAECDGALRNGTPEAHRFHGVIHGLPWEEVLQGKI